MAQVIIGDAEPYSELRIYSLKERVSKESKDLSSGLSRYQPKEELCGTLIAEADYSRESSKQGRDYRDRKDSASGRKRVFMNLDCDLTNDTQKPREILAEATETAYFSL